MSARSLIALVPILALTFALTGCGKDAELAQAQQDIQDLKTRVATLEGQVQAMAASLPEDAPVGDASPASASSTQ